GYVVCTCTTGGTTSGCSRTVRSRNESTPNATSTRLMTVANTGRLTEMSDNHIDRAPDARLSAVFLRGAAAPLQLRASAARDGSAAFSTPFDSLEKRTRLPSRSLTMPSDTTSSP